MNEMKMHARIGLSMIVACGLLASCGQRGALYLPDEDRNVVVTPAPVPAMPATPPGEAASTTEAEDEQRRNTTTAPAR
ncbi:MAG: lipoprotein [Gammaproteobacteria bacterium]|nr:lipoprotein [Gammaproteobacteria bacterium]